ncbi:MAG: AraC family transcriptional regulator [Clostridia bacterium]|nr:AraC family transcriptional regulator [Clostridia bacterium]
MKQEKLHNSVSTDKIIFNYYNSKGINERVTSDIHSHAYFELILFLDGDFSYVADDNRVPLKRNDLILTPPNVKHCLIPNGKTNYERYNVTFYPSGILDIDVFKIVERASVINVANNEIILNIFKKLDYYCSNLAINDFIEVSHCLLKELFYNLKIITEQKNEHSTNLSALTKEALSIINNKLFTITSIEEISKDLLVSETYLYRLFKKEMGISPKKYINEKRLLAAQNMLLLGKKPTEIYLYCGFNEYTSFYRNYIEYFGYAPSEESVQFKKD